MLLVLACCWMSGSRETGTSGALPRGAVKGGLGLGRVCEESCYCTVCCFEPESCQKSYGQPVLSRKPCVLQSASGFCLKFYEVALYIEPSSRWVAGGCFAGSSSVFDYVCCCCCSYLPLAHIYERNNMTVAVHLGGSVGFYSGNVQELLDDVLVRHRAVGLWC